LLECHLAMQLGVECDKHGSQASLGVRPEHPETLAVGCRGTVAVVDRDAGTVKFKRVICTNMRQRGLDVGIAQAGQTLASGAAGIDRRQALLDIVPMFLNVPRNEKLHGIPIAGTEISARYEMIGYGFRLVVSPRLKGGKKLPLVDEAILECKHPKKQISR
jgi:hypothetical protein